MSIQPIDPTPKLPSFYLSCEQVRDSSLLSPERWTELNAEIDRRISMPRDELGQVITSHRLADLSPYGRYLYPYMPHCPNWEYVRSQVLTAILTDDERKMLKDHAFEASCARKEEERFAKAEKILEENWMGGVFLGDTFYPSTEDFRDTWVCEHDFTPYDEPVEDKDRWVEEFPQYLWAARPQRVIPELDVADVVEHYVCDRGWLDMDTDDLNGVEALQSALDAFTKANEEVLSYEVDCTKAILLTREVKA
jgi:hypothetical protein